MVEQTNDLDECPTKLTTQHKMDVLESNKFLLDDATKIGITKQYCQSLGEWDRGIFILWCLRRRGCGFF